MTDPPLQSQESAERRTARRAPTAEDGDYVQRWGVPIALKRCGSGVVVSLACPCATRSSFSREPAGTELGITSSAWACPMRSHKGAILCAMRNMSSLILCAALLATAACSAQPKSDDDKVRALYAEFAAAVKAGDAGRIRELTCPQLRTSNDSAAWIKDANSFGDAAEVRIETVAGPKGEGVDSPDIEAWKSVDRIAVAKIDGEWYVCER